MATKKKLKKICKRIESYLENEKGFKYGEDYSFSIMEAYSRITIIGEGDEILAKVFRDDKEVYVYNLDYVMPLANMVKDRGWHKLVYKHRYSIANLLNN